MLKHRQKPLLWRRRRTVPQDESAHIPQHRAAPTEDAGYNLGAADATLVLLHNFLRSACPFPTDVRGDKSSASNRQLEEIAPKR